MFLVRFEQIIEGKVYRKEDMLPFVPVHKMTYSLGGDNINPNTISWDGERFTISTSGRDEFRKKHWSD